MEQTVQQFPGKNIWKHPSSYQHERTGQLSVLGEKEKQKQNKINKQQQKSKLCFHLRSTQ